MGINGMLEREDFYRILRNTIIEYARNVLHLNIQCEYDQFEGSEEWLVNTTLSFISKTPVPKGLRKYLKSEFNVRGSIKKNILGKLAVDIITTIPSIGTSKKIFISKGIFDPEVFIIPQNRSIRFYNYDKMTVDCIVKSGFTSKYFDNQIKFRSKYKYKFLNPMTEQGDGWFREPVLVGHPLIRTTDAHLFEKGTSESLQDLSIIANDTIKWVNTKGYVQSLISDITNKLVIASDRKKIKEVVGSKTLLQVAENLTSVLPNSIPIVMSHGDFQSGNIWVTSKGDTLVYDWETAGMRSIWYDSATLCYSLRREFGWGMMLSDLNGTGLIRCVPKGIKASFNAKGIWGILLLEDILFYLDDMLELPNDWGKDDYDAFILNVINLDWGL